MTFCNLAVLLAERNLKITKVSKDTGISRTTLTSLVSNRSLGIQFETLNKLCIYLNVSPEQLIEFIPYDFSIELNGFNRSTMNEKFSIELIIIEQKRKHRCKFLGKPQILFLEINDNRDMIISDINLEIILPDICREETDNDTLFGYKLIKGLPPYFQMSIGDLITDEIADILCMKLDETFFTNVSWFDDNKIFG